MVARSAVGAATSGSTYYGATFARSFTSPSRTFDGNGERAARYTD